MDERTKEALRYLGYGKHPADEKTLQMIEEAFSELEKNAGKRIVWRIFDLKRLGKSCIMIGNMQVESKNLSKNLQGCKKAIMLGATLGVGADLRIKRYSCTDIAKAVVMQSCAAVLLEEYLDDWQEETAGKMREEGYYLRPRFSPGYGDFPLAHQKEILTVLETAKKIGLTMTDGSMLTPTKSVTAVIGLSMTEENCHRSGCEMCEKKDCIYRRCED